MYALVNWNPIGGCKGENDDDVLWDRPNESGCSEVYGADGR